MLLFHEFEGTGYFSQVNEHSSGRVKKPDNGLATAIYLHMYMHVLCMYFVVLYFMDLPNTVLKLYLALWENLSSLKLLGF